jgi:hypothetical protein
MKDVNTRIVMMIKDIYTSSDETPVNIAKEQTNLYLKARKVFGSWREALEASGIDYEAARNNKQWSRNKIVSEIIKLHNNGHSLRPSILKKNGSIKLLSAANYHFGSWSRAVQTASLEYKFRRKRTK